MEYYNLLINEKQDISFDEIDTILKEISKQCRQYLYMNNDYKQSIDENGYYIFLSDKYESMLLNCNEILRQHGISTSILTDNELYPSDYENEQKYNEYDFSEKNIEEYDNFTEIFNNEQLVNSIENILKPFLEVDQWDITSLDEICKKILFLFSNSDQDYDMESLLSYLLFIFHTHNLCEDRNILEYSLYTLVKCLWSRNKEFFEKQSDYYVFVGKSELLWEPKINVLKKCNGQKYNGFWRLSFSTNDFSVYIFLHDNSKKYYNDNLINYLSDQIQKIKIPTNWDWINFEDFIHFRNFNMESDLNMTEFKDYYKILGVSLDDNLSTIKASYKNKINECHPDISKNINANEQSILLNEAYQILSDDLKRTQYDKKYKKINFI